MFGTRRLSIAAMAIIVAACGTAAAPTAAPSASAIAASASAPATSVPAPATTGHVVMAADGYEITLPDGWVRVDLSGDDISALMKSLKTNESKNTALLAMLAGAASQNMHFVALDTTSTTFWSNINIIRQEARSIPIDLLVAQVKIGLAAFSDSMRNPQLETASIPAGAAVRATYTLDPSITNGADATGTQYYLPTPDFLLVVSITCGATDDNCADETDALADSLRILP